MKLRVFRTARTDIYNAQDWYEQAQAGLAASFTDEIDQALQLLMLQPGMGSKRYAHLTPEGNLRCWGLDRFPFLVFYRCVPDEGSVALEVLRLIHESRDIPSAWVLH